MKKDVHPQGNKAGKLIEFILGRKNAYYEANVTQRWRQACYGIECALDQKFTEEEEGLTRSQFYLSRLVNSDDALVETYTDGYTMANPLFVMNTKRKGTQEFAERAGNLMHNLHDEAEALDTHLAHMQDINRFGMGVGYSRWERREGQDLGLVEENMPWGILARVAMQDRTLYNRAIIERVHPFDWWGYWRTHMTPPWEGISREWGGCEFYGILEDDSYEAQGVKLAMARLKKGGGTEDEYFHGAELDDVQIPEHHTLMVYEYWGDLYGLEGYENDSNEYQVIITDNEVLMMPRRNQLPGFRPIKRPRGIIVTDWCCGRPALLPLLPAVRIQNFLVNSSLDDVSDRLYAGWAVWENALQNPDEFLNPEGIGVPVRMNKDATATQIPVRIGGGQSGIQADVDKIANGPLEKDIQGGSFADVMNMKGGLQDGTARAANIIASQGARKVRRIYENANRTGLLPFAEQLMIHTILNVPPEELANQTRDGNPFTMENRDFGYLLQRNLWDCNDSFRRDPFMDAQNMERLAKAGAVQFLVDHAVDPLTPAKYWRSYARQLNIPDYDEYFPLSIKQPGLPPQVGGPAGAAAAAAQGGPGGAPPQEPGAEVPEGAAMAAAA